MVVMMMPYEDWMNEKLKYYVLVLVLSILEKNKNDEITKRVMRKINVEILQSIICFTFKNYKTMYKEKNEELVREGFIHYDIDLDEIKDQKNIEFEKKKLECIIENGFYAYFLVAEYSEIQDLNFMER